MGSLLGGWWLRGLVLWAVLVGWSRIHLGVHYPGDVLCGWIVGSGLGAAALTFVRRTLKLCPTP
jgi:undecaprenyl-diphosphatase